ncbi:protein kinase [Micromonospora sp. NPDC049366]|uniref:serine/threonine-protein kinase n=1 Tax=Micromonospora sp. NPDC049366 TaxID=3364271 RepID=UPI0037A8A8E9
MQARDRIGDRYELTYPIGRGGMGQVWAGYDERLDRPVAVKFLRHREVPENEREVAVKRFRREARLTAGLEHPGVPAVHDLGEHGDDLYIVMQLVRGYPLADLIAEQEQLTVGEAVSIATQVCSVLAAAHATSLVHRDLKPQNIMITPSGSVKVLDFGVAALLGPAEQSRLTATGHTLGTPAYIAPEQASGAATGPAADLYALGCILFEMLTGKPPYEARNAPDMLRQHMHSPIPILTEYRPDVPDDLGHLIFCLLGKQPSDRPETAERVAHLLAPFRHDERTTPARGIGGTEGRSQTSPPQPPLHRSDRDLAELHQYAQALAEEERFTQAIELLERLLPSAPTSPTEHAAQGVAIRLDLANLRMLTGDYRAARDDFTELARLLQRSGGDQSVVQHCQEQARLCQTELGE